MAKIGTDEQKIKENEETKVIDKMMTLSKELQQSFDQKITCLEEGRRMPLLSNMEEREIERGKLQTAHEWLIKFLETRFGTISTELTDQIHDLSDLDTLTELFQKAITSNSLEEFQEFLRFD